MYTPTAFPLYWHLCRAQVAAHEKLSTPLAANEGLQSFQEGYMLQEPIF